MKKHLFTFILIMVFSIVTACGNNNANPAPKENNNTTTNEDVAEERNNENGSTVSTEANEEQEYLETQLNELPFAEIDIDVSYGKDKDFEVSIDRDDEDQRIEVEFEDEIDNVFYKGREAMDHIKPKLDTLDINSESTEQEVIEQILNAFDLSDDYEKFEIEIDFDDGKRIDFEHRK